MTGAGSHRGQIRLSDVVVGIPAYERGELTTRCVEAVRRTAPSVAAIIVADDGSETEQTRNLLSELSREQKVQVVRSETNQGPSAARNLILAAAPRGTTAFAFLDNDIIALEGWLEGGIKALEEEFDLVQPLQLSPNLTTIDRGPNRAQPDSLSAHPDYLALGAAVGHPMAQQRSENAVVSGTFLVRAEVFEALGSFDSRFRVGEDYELSFRAIRAGFRLGFEPSSRVVHDHGFDLPYDLVRSSPGECLRSHWLMLELHGRTLYSPRHFAWYRWLLVKGEPMYLSEAERRAGVFRRLRRRLTKTWLMRRRPAEWVDLANARALARSLAAAQGWPSPELASGAG